MQKNQKNKDGTNSLYDNDRFKDETLWHEQILAAEIQGPKIDLENGTLGLLGFSGWLYTGGWEGSYLDVSLFDFGHVEANLQIQNSTIEIGAFASVWSPSASIEILGFEITFGAEVLSTGAALTAGANGFGFSLGELFGYSFSISWD